MSRAEPVTDVSLGTIPTAPVNLPGVPVSMPVTVSSDPADSEATGNLISPTGATVGFKFCVPDFREGCYQIAIATGISVFGDRFEGTLRVDRHTPGGPDGIIVSGDLYRAPGLVIFPGSAPGDPAIGTLASAVSGGEAGGATGGVFQPPTPPIPIFPRSRYHSYLKITQISIPGIVPAGQPCLVTLTAEQFEYTQPPPGQFQGSFPASPTRTVSIVLTQAPPPPFFAFTGGPYFQGRVHEGAVDKGAISLGWVAPSLRRATVVVRQVANTVPPPFVPDRSGGVEHFNTIYARAGWELGIVRDHRELPVRPGVTPTDCWSNADLHDLMSSAPAADLDAVWNVNLMVVPAKLGCSRGVMFDTIGTPREGCATFCDDGYPTSDSSDFGTAANHEQRDVPRAYLRSATHEVTHTFNQIHQEIETVADNSIMTTTPSVAGVPVRLRL